MIKTLAILLRGGLAKFAFSLRFLYTADMFAPQARRLANACAWIHACLA